MLYFIFVYNMLLNIKLSLVSRIGFTADRLLLHQFILSFKFSLLNLSELTSNQVIANYSIIINRYIYRMFKRHINK